MTKTPLKGIRVLDLSQLIAGPYCTKLLAGVGAEVVKVELPGSGDISRCLGPFPQGQSDPEVSALFLYLNTNKKSITLNLREKEGQDICRGLVSAADVVVESFAPGTMERWGLGYEQMTRLNPGIVLTSVTPFGQTRPYRNYHAREIVLQAMGGLMHITGSPEGPPLQDGFAVAQYSGGQGAFAATLAALLNRQFTGHGDHVDISMMDCLFSVLESMQTQFSYNQEVRGRTGATVGALLWGTYPCKEGHLGMVLGRRPDAMEALAKLTGIQEFMNPKYTSMEGRRAYTEEIEALFRPWLLGQKARDVFYAGQRERLPVGYLCTMEDLLKQDHLQERGFFQEIHHPQAGSLPYPRGPFNMSRGQWQGEPAPLLGQHNAEVLQEWLGCSRDQVEGLEARGVV